MITVYGYLCPFCMNRSEFMKKLPEFTKVRCDCGGILVYLDAEEKS